MIADIADRRHESGASHTSDGLDQMTLKPSKSSAVVKSLPPFQTPVKEKPVPAKSIPEEDVDDYSDIAFGETELGLETKLANMKVCF
jgi:hypothetical protein